MEGDIRTNPPEIGTHCVAPASAHAHRFACRLEEAGLLGQGA
jgi:hypothetical protein